MKKYTKTPPLVIGLTTLCLVAAFVVFHFISYTAPGDEVVMGPHRPLSNDSTKKQPISSLQGHTGSQSGQSGTLYTVSTPGASILSSLPSPFTDRRIGDFVIDQSGASYPIRTYKPLATPNDPMASQWWVSNTSLNLAWDVPAGAQQTTLAIIDTGFALSHEEFSNRWYQNTGEKGSASSQAPSVLNCSDRGLALDKSCNNIDDDFDGILDNETGLTTKQNPSLLNCTDQSKALDKSCNNIDDDGNSLIDDITGWDFATFYPSSQAGKTNPSGSSTTHGTNVAGIAGATGNNGRGIAGTDWQTKILPIQAINDDGYGDTLTVSRAIRYAADRGANVISLSLGTPYPDDYMRQALAYAIAKGSIIVAAAGNDGCDCMIYPAKYEEVVAVGSSNESNARASFSSYGASLDVVASGVNMISPTWTSSNGFNVYANNLAGTSFSTPLVAGLLSLARSHQPQASSAQLVGTLTETTNRLTIPTSIVRTSELGYGMANASSMLSRASSVASATQRYSFSPVSGGSTLGNFEPIRSFHVYQCQNGRPGSTNIYKLTNSSNFVYTVSFVEVYKSVASGYASSLWSEGLCISLPTDQPQAIRTLSIPIEFENRTPKQP